MHIWLQRALLDEHVFHPERSFFLSYILKLVSLKNNYEQDVLEDCAEALHSWIVLIKKK